ncbi:hypothetical protein [Chryseolinea sp. H1M3-3]|uniref:hypothetical protein n=1 Tax=Chryseolinea sp. H1M3-3 TaxID=3034144 RepID=UPI0023ED5932|nr:hypothetical protein [Chryseolinea sp. H1M3-3]
MFISIILPSRRIKILEHLKVVIAKFTGVGFKAIQSQRLTRVNLEELDATEVNMKA